MSGDENLGNQNNASSSLPHRRSVEGEVLLPSGCPATCPVRPQFLVISASGPASPWLPPWSQGSFPGITKMRARADSHTLTSVLHLSHLCLLGSSQGCWGLHEWEEALLANVSV